MAALWRDKPKTLKGLRLKDELRWRPLLVVAVLLISLMTIQSWADASSTQLNPTSMSFPTARLGFVLSTYDCATKTCAALGSSDNAGSTWNVVPTPSQLGGALGLISWRTYVTSYTTLNVHFADAENGWIYGTVPAPTTSQNSGPNWVERTWSTHDGGRTWRRVLLGRLSVTSGVIDMATHGAWTYLFGESGIRDRAYILGTHSNVEQWKNMSDEVMELPAGGTQLEGEFNFKGSSGWFVSGNDRGYTASSRLSANGMWRKWKGPSFEGFGSSYCPLATVTSAVYLSECQSAGFVIPPASSVPPNWNNGAPWLFISHNAGRTFTPFRELSTSYRGGYYATAPGLPATPVPGTILLQRSINSELQLVRSTNWGRTWQVVLKRNVSQVVFVSHSKGFTIEQPGTNLAHSTLLQTNDAGRHWSRVSI